MTAGTPLPVADTVLAVWRQFAARPGYALKVAWIPVFLLAGIGAFTEFLGGSVPGFWRPVFAILNFAVLVQALVAWQRYALPESHPRKGPTGLRGGRAELLTLMHFPLVGILYVPLFIPTLVESLVAVQQVHDGINDMAVGLAGLALLVFPGGLVWMRAALMLAAIAAAGNNPISLLRSANRVWQAGAGHSIRILAVFYLAVLPPALALILLPTALPVAGGIAANAVLLPVYVMLCGGALGVTYGRLAAAGARKAHS